MEAAYSILQALNVTSALGSNTKTGDKDGPSQSADSNANATVLTESNIAGDRPPVVAGDFTLPSFSSISVASASSAPPVRGPSIPASGTQPPATTSTVSSNRAALQGSLALLAAQLAELADSAMDKVQHQASSLPELSGSRESSASGAVNLEGIGFDLFGVSWNTPLRGIDVSAKQ